MQFGLLQSTERVVQNFQNRGAGLFLQLGMAAYRLDSSQPWQKGTQARLHGAYCH